jgi:hypothetical protein
VTPIPGGPPAFREGVPWRLGGYPGAFTPVTRRSDSGRWRWRVGWETRVEVHPGDPALRPVTPTRRSTLPHHSLQLPGFQIPSECSTPLHPGDPAFDLSAGSVGWREGSLPRPGVRSECRVIGVKRFHGGYPAVGKPSFTPPTRRSDRTPGRYRGKLHSSDPALKVWKRSSPIHSTDPALANAGYHRDSTSSSAPFTPATRLPDPPIYPSSPQAPGAQLPRCQRRLRDFTRPTRHSPPSQAWTPGRYREPRNFFPGRSPGPRRWPPAGGGGAGAKKERKGGGGGGREKGEKGLSAAAKTRSISRPMPHVHLTYPAFVCHRAASRSVGRRPWTVPHPATPGPRELRPPSAGRLPGGSTDRLPSPVYRKPPEPTLGKDAGRSAPDTAPWNPRPARATPSVTLPARRRAGGGRVSVDSRSEKKNWSVAGWRSADRSNKTTLPRTRPDRTTKSYARVLTPRKVKLQSADWTPELRTGARCRPAGIQGRSLFVSDYDVRGKNRRVLAWILT